MSETITAMAFPQLPFLMPSKKAPVSISGEKLKPRPTTLSFGGPVKVDFSPMTVGTPGTPHVSETGSVVTPGCKRSVIDINLDTDDDIVQIDKLICWDDEFSKELEKQTDSALNPDPWDQSILSHTLSHAHTLFELEDIDMEVELPSKPQAKAKKALRRLAHTPVGEFSWETEVLALPKGVTSPFVTCKKFVDDDDDW